MKWIKKGKIFDCHSFSLHWFTKNAMMPLPYRYNDETLRLFVTFCDDENIGRIGYVDVNLDNPSNILAVSSEPIVNIGEPGTFDDNGVVTGSLFEQDGKLYLFYSGYQLCRKVPYMIFSGIAVSEDRGDSFKKLTSDVPLLDRIASERNFRCVPTVIRHGTTLKMWYHADCLQQSAWLVDKNGKMLPVYAEKYMESDDLMQWNGTSENVLEFANEDEHGLSIGSIWIENGEYKCIYSVRSLSKGYRLGYAESSDGKHFIRKDSELGLDVTPGAFDSDMMCYAKRIELEHKIYLFYSGNHYGLAGVGYAEMEKR